MTIRRRKKEVQWCVYSLLDQTFGLRLVGVGDEKSAAREGHGALVDAAPSLEVLGIPDALLPRQGGIEKAVAGQLRGARVGQLGQGVGLLGTTATARALRTVELVLPGLVLGLALGQAARPLGRVAGAPFLATLTLGRAAGCAEGGGPPAARSAAAAAAPGPTMVQASHGEVVVVAVLALDLGGAQTQGHAADADVIVLGSVADDAGLAMMSYLGGDLAGTAAQTGGGAAVGGASEDLLIGPLFRGALLSGYPRIFILGSIAPYGGLLFPEQRDITHGLRWTTAGSRGGATADIVGRGGAEGGGRRVAGGGTEGVDGR